MRNPRVALLLLLLALVPMLTLAFSSLETFDGSIPGTQLVFLAPSGRAMSIPKSGGVPVAATKTRSAKVVPSGFVTVGALDFLARQSGSDFDSIAFPVREVSSGNYWLLVRKWTWANGTWLDSSNAPRQTYLANDIVSSDWAGDTLCLLSRGSGRGWIAARGSVNVYSPWFRYQSGATGMKVWPNFPGYRVLTWSGNQINVTIPTGTVDTALPSAPTGVSIVSAGLWKNGAVRQWVVVGADRHVYWQSGQVDSIPQIGQILPDDSTHGSTVLLWIPTSGELWRLSPGTKTRLASSLADVMQAGTGGASQYLLLGGTMATASSTLGQGIRFLGSLHQPGHPEIGSFRVDPALFSPKLGSGVNITAGVLAPGEATWVVWLRRPNGDSVFVGQGSVLPAGTLSLPWSGRTNGSTPDATGIWKAYIKVIRGTSAVVDSAIFELDAIAPVGSGIWSTASSSTTVSPTTPWVANLTNAVDNQDTTRPVVLVVRFERNGVSYFTRVQRSNLTNHKWSFNGQLSDGSLLPEGDYTTRWALVDLAGNATDSSTTFVPGVTNGLVRVRWSGPSVRARLNPIQAAARTVFHGSLHVDISGTASTVDTIKIKGPDSATMAPTTVVLRANGQGSVDIPVTCGALDAGTYLWSVTVTEAGLSTKTSAVMFVGEVGPSISYPVQASVLKAKGGSILVQGIAPDPNPSDSGSAVYRISLHPGTISVPATTGWDYMSTLPSTTILPVVETKAVPVAAKIPLDLANVPGSVGSALRLGVNEDLAQLNPTILKDSVYTLVLWVGKRNLVKTASATFTLDRSGMSTRSTSLRLLSPAAPILDRSDNDTTNDTLRWRLSGASGLTTVLSVWSTGVGIVPQRIWEGLPADSSVKFGGSGSDLRALPSGSYVMRATSSNLDGQWTAESPFSVVASPLAWTSSFLQVSPGTLDLSMARVLGDSLRLQCKVGLPRLDTTRLVIRDPSDPGHPLVVLGPRTSTAWELDWNGLDESGRLWLDPMRSPMTGISKGRLLVSLERKNGSGWDEIDRDTVGFSDIPSRQVSQGSLLVQGRDQGSLRIADLISDYKLRAKFAGNLLVFPTREAEFQVHPKGTQIARHYKPTDYQIYWAKYYNSIAGFENYTGNYIAKGFRWDWWKMKTKENTYLRSAQMKESPFWMLANSGNTGMGIRDQMHVVSPDTVGITRGMRVGIPPRYQAALDTQPFEIERNSLKYRFSPRSFFGDGVNHELLSNKGMEADSFYLSNSGYSGFHDDDPLTSLFNWSNSRFQTVMDTGNFLFCKEVKPVCSESPRAQGCDSVVSSPTNPIGHDKNLSRIVARRISDQHPEWLRCPTPGRDTMVSQGRWEVGCLHKNGRDTLIPGGIDSLPDPITKVTYGINQECTDSTLEAVYLNMRLAGVALPQNVISLQEYTQSISDTLQGTTWASPHNISASFHLTRPRCGVMDDAWWYAAPTDWQQSYYVYGPGYRKEIHDSLGMNLYTINRRADMHVIDLDGSHDWFLMDKDTLTTRSGFDRVIPRDSTGRSGYRDSLRPGEGPWFMRYEPSFTGCCTDDAGYRYKNGFNYRGHNRLPDVYNWRPQIAYTVPPRLNWMNPWFYIGDSTTTVLRMTLYADSAINWSDPYPWDDAVGTRTSKGTATFGGYKEGQVGYWFRPALDSEHRVLPRNSDGEVLSEVDFIQEYSHHIHLDLSDTTNYSNHNLRFEPRLLVNYRTRGVVWDTAAVGWPVLDAFVADHLDRASLQDSTYSDSAALGRTWATLPVSLNPDSLWIPKVSDLGKVASDSLQYRLWQAFPRLPGEFVTGRDSSRADSLYGYVQMSSLSWGVSPFDQQGLLIPDQSKLQWHLVTTDTVFQWEDRYQKKQLTLSVRNPILSVGYVLNPDTLQSWSSASDPVLAAQNGWLYLSDSLNPTPEQSFDPVRSNISLIPTHASDSVVRTAPCYRPWVTAAFVRLHDAGSVACKDSLSLNPNLLLSGNTARWNVEVYYPDGQTPNLDMGQGTGSSLQNLTLRLSDNRSSQRWVRLQGTLPDTVQQNGASFHLVYWRVFGSHGGKVADLDLPAAQTDSLHRKVGFRNAALGDNPWAPSDVPDLAWWNVTGLQGSSQFLVQGIYATSTDSFATWARIPFVLGTPRSTASSTTVTDAYGRAVLNMPPDSTGSATPVVLNTLAGSDLNSLPLNGATPLGPVIKMSPSGTRFQPPASLEYRLTLRELLSLMGTPAVKDSLAIDSSYWNRAWSWANAELAIWELTDAGSFELTQTVITAAVEPGARRMSLDNSQVLLTGQITHFSYATVLHRNPLKNLAPRWIEARRSGGGLRLSLDAIQAMALGAVPKVAHVRLSASPVADTGKFASGEMILNFHNGRIDTLVSSLPAAWGQVLSRSQSYVFARMDSGTTWGRGAVEDSSAMLRFGPVEVAPTYVHSTCADTVRMHFSSNLSGSVRARVVNGSGAEVVTLRASVTSGSDTLAWPVCLNGIPAPRGIYQALIESVQPDGSTVSDSSLHLAIWGVDSLVPTLGSIQMTDPVTVPRDSSPARIAAAFGGWPSNTIWKAQLRRVLDQRAAPGDSIWMDLPVPSAGMDSVRTSWDARSGSEWAPRGTYQVRIQGLSGTIKVTRAALFELDTEAIELSLALESTGSIYQGERVSAVLTGRGVSSWELQVLDSSRIVGRLVGIAAGDMSTRQVLRTDTLPHGRYQICAQVTGAQGARRVVCQDLLVRALVPRLMNVSAQPFDTIWEGWSADMFRRHPERMSRWIARGQVDRAGSLLRAISRSGSVLRQDTLAVDPGYFSWEWDGTVAGKNLPEGRIQVSIWADNGTSIADSALTWSLQIHRVPRVFVWAGSASDTFAASLTDAIVQNGVQVVRGDATSASEFLRDNPKGTLVMLDTALSHKLWSGRASGPLIPWTLGGGNAVFVGAPSLSAWRDSSNVLHAADGQDVARMAIYGSTRFATPATLIRSFASGIRAAALRIDSTDEFSRNLWGHATGSSMPWGLRMSWFDSMGIELEAGLLHRQVDSLPLRTRQGRDTVVLDSSWMGGLNYYPEQDSGTRHGQILELPTIASMTDAVAAGRLIWAQLLVPDFGITHPDIQIHASPNGTRVASKWRPIPGDSLHVAVNIRVRDGGLDSLPDSAVVDFGRVANLWNDTTFVVKPVRTGRITLPTLRAKLVDSFPYGTTEFVVKIRPFQMETLTEPYQGNNITEGEFLVGDTAAPHLAWSDSTTGPLNGIWSRVAPVAAGKPFAIGVKAWTRHHQPQWSWGWEMKDASGTRVAIDTGIENQQDTAQFHARGTIASDAIDDDQRSLVFRGHDAFGNSDSIQLDLHVDAENPRLIQFTVDGAVAQKDTVNDDLVSFLLPASAGSRDTARIQIQDNHFLGQVTLVGIHGDSTRILDTILGQATLSLKFSVPVTRDGEDSIQIEPVMKLVIRDLAGNDTVVNFAVLAEPPPIPALFRVRIPNGSSFLYPTALDTMKARSGGVLSVDSVWQFVNSNRSLLTKLNTNDTENVFGGRTHGDSGIIYRTSRRGVPMDFVFAPATNVSLKWLKVTVDGNSVTVPPAFQNVSTPLEHHPSQRLFEFIPTKPRHRMVVSAEDFLGDADSLVVMLDDSLSDLQVIDSANDQVQGADWGEVYMRRNVFTTPELGNPQTWDYWLIQRRNPMVRGERDNRIYRLMVDQDGDSTTGDTSTNIPRGFKGADEALEWTHLTTSDDGTAAQITLWNWNPEFSTWVSSQSSQEGQDMMKGFGFHMNEADDPNTVPVGLGDQRLPSGTTAAATGGVIELGLRSGASASFHPIRWAIVPDGFVGDTVRGDSGMLTFKPEDFKPVKVDGDATDWWPNNTPARIELRSFSDSIGDTLRVSVGIRNPTTRTIHGISMAYWVLSDSTPNVALSGLPLEWRKLSLLRPQMDTNMWVDTLRHLYTWKIEMVCDSCVVPGGSNFNPIAQLKIVRHSDQVDSSKDWSNSQDSTNWNENFTAYDRAGHLIAGNEPPPRDLRGIVAKISPSGVIWMVVGQSMVVRADSSFDPEHRKLGYLWTQSEPASSRISVSDTVRAVTPGVFTVQLKVFDLADPENRFAYAVDTIFVQDSAGYVGSRPTADTSVQIFGDRWSPDWAWGENWTASVGHIGYLDSLHDASGNQVVVNPSEGDSLYSFTLNEYASPWIRASCDSSYTKDGPPYRNWCLEETDLNRYTNLEFDVAMDAGIQNPVRILLTRTAYPSGSTGPYREEKSAYLGAYMKDPVRTSSWQHVSIPLDEIYSEPQERTSGFLQLKLNSDGLFTTHRKVLLDNMRLVKYATAPGVVVTTRKTDIQVMANTTQSGQVDILGLTNRIQNSSTRSFHLDSLRLRWFYKSMENTARSGQNGDPDTVFGSDAAHFDGLMPDSGIDPVAYRNVIKDFDWTLPATSKANRSMNLRWAPVSGANPSTLQLRPIASTYFWTGVEVPATIGNNSTVNVPFQGFVQGRSLHWSWPDSVPVTYLWQFAPGVVIDGVKPDGTIGRLWGIAPNEDPELISYWTDRTHVDPSNAIDISQRIKAHITVTGTTIPGARLQAVANASVDPLGHPLQFYWVDSLGRVLQVGAVDSFVVPDTGRIMLRLRAFDLLDPTRMGSDSLAVYSVSAVAPVDSLRFLTGHGGIWSYVNSWGSSTNPSDSAAWVSSVDLPATDGACSVRLLPASGDSILVIPFSHATLDGLRFQAPSAALDTSRFTHLEFWVASSRDWPNRDHRDLPVRFWLTHQIQPETGEDNHASEEDFNLVQAYLPGNRLLRKWHKVVIPIDELYQPSQAAHSDPNHLFLKFMVDRSFTNTVDAGRRADFFLSGIRWTKYPSGPRVTTRKVGAMVFGLAHDITQVRMELRLLNPTRMPLHSDSLRMRTFYGSATQGYAGFGDNGQGTDESISSDWFYRAVDSSWSFGAVVDERNRVSNHGRQLTWSSSVAMAPGKGWEATWWLNPIDELFLSGLSTQHFAPDSSSSFSMMNGVVVDYRTGEGWKRLWGYNASEDPDTVEFWGREPLRVPHDTAAPEGSVIGLGSCLDTTVHSTSNTYLPPGDPSALPSTGRDDYLTVTPVTAGGRPALQVTQKASTYNLMHDFVFDTAWAHHSVIDVDVYLDPSDITGSAWPGILMLATQNHVDWDWEELQPLNDSMSQAIGKWTTLRFQYDPTRYPLDGEFTLYLEANGHANSAGEAFRFYLGAVRLEGASNSDTGNGGTGDSVSNPDTLSQSPLSRSLDSLSQLTSCNLCAIVTDSGRMAVAVEPAQGGTAFSFDVIVDTALLEAHKIVFDLKSEFTLAGWEQAWFFVDDTPYRLNWDQYLVNIPTSVSSGWTTVAIPFNGSLYQLGSTAHFLLSLNANPPTGKRMYVDNVRWTP